jgi:pilus assembly protein CpaD
MPAPSKTLSRTASLGVVALGLLATAACAPNDRVVLDPAVTDIRQAHPIVLARGERSIDVFVAGGAGAIGSRQIADIRSFAQEYRRTAKGPMIIAKPINNPEAGTILPSIRRALAEGGVGSAVITAYTPADPTESAPVRLSFAALKAEVATQCGRWPSDLSGNQNFESWQNTAYENFGCASQSALAQQVADPLDLERARPGSPPDADHTVTVMTKYEKGEPTAVQYPDDNKNKIKLTLGQ